MAISETTALSRN